MDQQPEQVFETEAYKRHVREENGYVDWTTDEEKAQFFAELKGHAAGKGWKPGWPAMKFKARFFIWPPRSIENIRPAAPSVPTILWLKGEQQEYFKQQQRDRRRGRNK